MDGIQSKLLPLRSLIIVCCHATWIGGSTKGSDEREWFVIHRLPSLPVTEFTNLLLSSLCSYISILGISMRKETFIPSIQRMHCLLADWLMR